MDGTLKRWQPGRNKILKEHNIASMDLVAVIKAKYDAVVTITDDEFSFPIIIKGIKSSITQWQLVCKTLLKYRKSANDQTLVPVCNAIINKMALLRRKQVHM